MGTMKDKGLAKALEAVLEAGDAMMNSATSDELPVAWRNWEQASTAARALLKNRQVRDERAKKNHTSRKSK